MTLKEYLETIPRGAKLEMAKKLGISKTWMALIISGREVPSAGLAVNIHQITKGKVSREELRPDLFGALQ